MKLSDMPLLRLREPSFPIRVKREAKTRAKWINAGAVPFRIACTNTGVRLYRMTKPPELEKKGKEKFLVIHANPSPVAAVAEVWDALGKLCRIWFTAEGVCYEAAAMNGWNPRESLPPVSTTEISQQAFDKAGEIALEMWLGR